MHADVCLWLWRKKFTIFCSQVTTKTFSLTVYHRFHAVSQQSYPFSDIVPAAPLVCLESRNVVLDYLSNHTFFHFIIFLFSQHLLPHEGGRSGQRGFFLKTMQTQLYYYNITISFHGERELRDPIKGKQIYICLIHIFSTKRDMHVLNMG